MHNLDRSDQGCIPHRHRSAAARLISSSVPPW
jgi:hypothetical protein